MIPGKPSRFPLLLFPNADRMRIYLHAGFQAIAQKETVLPIAVSGASAKKQGIMHISPQQRLMSGRNAVCRIASVIPMIDPMNVLIPVSASGRRYLHIDQDHIRIRQFLVYPADPLLIVLVQHDILIGENADIRRGMQERRVTAKAHTSLRHGKDLYLMPCFLKFLISVPITLIHDHGVTADVHPLRQQHRILLHRRHQQLYPLLHPSLHNTYPESFRPHSRSQFPRADIP